MFRLSNENHAHWHMATNLFVGVALPNAVMVPHDWTYAIAVLFVLVILPWPRFNPHEEKAKLELLQWLRSALPGNQKGLPQDEGRYSEALSIARAISPGLFRSE